MFEVATLRGYFIFRKREEVRYPAYSIDSKNKIIYLYCGELTTLRENVLICKAFGQLELFSEQDPDIRQDMFNTEFAHEVLLPKEKFNYLYIKNTSFKDGVPVTNWENIQKESLIDIFTLREIIRERNKEKL